MEVVIKYLKAYHEDERTECSVYPQEGRTRNNGLYRIDFWINVSKILQGLAKAIQRRYRQLH